MVDPVNDGEDLPSTPPSGSVPWEYAPFPYQVLDSDGVIQSVNDAWLDVVGADRRTVEGRSFEEFLVGPSTDRFATALRTLAEAGQVADLELELRGADRETLVVSLSGRAEYDEAGDLDRIHCQFRDITAEQQRRDALQRERDRLRAITSAIPDLVLVYDGEGTIREILTGRSDLLVDDADALVGRTVWETLDESAAETIQAAIDRTIETGEMTTVEYELDFEDGSRWFEGRVVPFPGHGSGTVVWAARNITRRKDQERELRTTKERLEMALEGASLGIWDWDMTTGQVSRDELLTDMLGYAPGEMGDTLADWERIVHPEGERRHNEALAEHVENRTAYYECDYRMETKSGDWKWVRIIGKVVERDADGTPLRAVGIHQDIDDRKRTHQQLARKTDQLEALNRVVRHDIRNDMNIIHGWAQQLEAHVDEEGREALERVLGVSEHVIELTEVAREFVDSLGAEADVDLEAVPLDQHLRAELDTQRENYPEAEIEISGPLPEVSVRANEMLSSVFRNLLVNAVQHNDASTPEITIQAEAGADTARVRIADNGPGIPADRREAVFGRGERGLDSTGTGIGLYLVQSLVDRYDGDVWIEDNDPRGAVFVVELPRAA